MDLSPFERHRICQLGLRCIVHVHRAAERPAGARRASKGLSSQQQEVRCLRRRDQWTEISRRALILLPVFISSASSMALSTSSLQACAPVGTCAPVQPRRMLYLAHFKLGYNYEQKGAWQAAAREYQQALEMKSDFAPAREQLESVRSRLRNPQP